jgi:threonine synthase
LLVGIYKGFQELRRRRLVEALPRMVAAQAAACAPIARAFQRGDECVQRWDGPADTVAGGIADPLAGYEPDGSYTLRVVRESDGLATASSDEDILTATHALAREEGIFCEPTGAVSLAALDQVKNGPFFSAEQLVVCLATGHGLKQVRAFEGADPAPRGDRANAGGSIGPLRGKIMMDRSGEESHPLFLFSTHLCSAADCSSLGGFDELD